LRHPHFRERGSEQPPPRGSANITASFAFVMRKPGSKSASRVRAIVKTINPPRLG